MVGVSPLANSQRANVTMPRLGLRLLTRTTRSVAPTEVGERLLRSVAPRIDEIQAELAGRSNLRDRPVGTIRISADEHAASMVLWPALERFLPNYPDIKAEIVVDNGLIDIVAERFDAGVRTGGIIAKDMIAVPIGPDIRMWSSAPPPTWRPCRRRRYRRT
jgi:DNA-binding transcriptional LysR family regulator